MYQRSRNKQKNIKNTETMDIIKVSGSITPDSAWKQAEGSSIQHLLGDITNESAIVTVKPGKVKVFAMNESGTLCSLCTRLFSNDHVGEAKNWLRRAFPNVELTDLPSN